MSVHQALRTATRAAHERVDARFSGLNLADLDDYRRFIGLHAAAFLPVEQGLTDAGASRLVEDWDRMRRTPELVADLEALGLSLPPVADGPSFDDEAAMLGGIYVLEGSRLGGQLLRRSVDPAFPHRFLGHTQPSGRWRDLVALMERKLYQPVLVERAVRSALDVFACFERAEWDAA